MKKIMISLLSVSALSACFHDIETPEATIDYPVLTVQSDFDALQSNSEEAVLDEELAKQAVSDVLFRFMNIVDFANQSTALVAEAGNNAPLMYKPMARELYIEDASSEFCSSSSSTKSNNEASIWDDRDNSGNASEGDVWYYRIQNCQLKMNSAFTTGLISQTGVYELFLNDDSTQSASDGTFENYLYTLDIQIDPQNGKIAYFKNTSIDYSKPEEEIATATILKDSLMGVIKSGLQEDDSDSLYLFEFESAFIKNDDDAETVEIDFSAKYYSTELGGYISVETSNTLKFAYTYKTMGAPRDNNNPYESINLLSGKLQISTSEDSAIFTVDSSDTNNVKIIFNNDSANTESFLQSDFFNVELDESNSTSRTFSLVNMSG